MNIRLLELIVASSVMWLFKANFPLNVKKNESLLLLPSSEEISKCFKILNFQHETHTEIIPPRTENLTLNYCYSKKTNLRWPDCPSNSFHQAPLEFTFSVRDKLLLYYFVYMVCICIILVIGTNKNIQKELSGFILFPLVISLLVWALLYFLTTLETVITWISYLKWLQLWIYSQNNSLTGVTHINIFNIMMDLLWQGFWGYCACKLSARRKISISKVIISLVNLFFGDAAVLLMLLADKRMIYIKKHNETIKMSIGEAQRDIHGSKMVDLPKKQTPTVTRNSTKERPKTKPLHPMLLQLLLHQRTWTRSIILSGYSESNIHSKTVDVEKLIAHQLQQVSKRLYEAETNSSLQLSLDETKQILLDTFQPSSSFSFTKKKSMESQLYHIK